MSYERLRDACRGERLPLALVDLEALEHNVDHVVARAGGKPVRVATKSVRSVDLLRIILARGGDRFRGLMAYSAAEAVSLVERGFDDLLVAYPTTNADDLEAVARASKAGATIAITADDPAHLALAIRAAEACSAKLRVVVDLDVALRVAGAHLGAKRSPLHAPDAVADFAASIASEPSLELAGLLGYEAHLAGLPDRAPGSPAEEIARRLFKRVAMPSVVSLRRSVLEAVRARGLDVALFNGGGSGSLVTSAADPSLTEITVGSAFLAGHLFDRYDAIDVRPAAYFALAVTRAPAPGFVTCQSGGFIASGATGVDRSPAPALPAGLRLSSMEGAGEVQTPLVVPPGVHLAVGDPVFFRHAKSGELAEHFDRYVLVRGARREGEALTYRGAGKTFY